MKKEIIDVDKAKGIMRVTGFDQRWYVKPDKNSVSGLPEYKFVPSVTWVASFYPKSIGFYRWLAEKGWDESEAIKSAAGDKGSKVHAAISAVLRNEEVRIDSKFINPTTEKEEELTIDEIDCIKSFVDWKNAVKPVTIAWDLTVFSDKHNYAGTIDYICKINDEVYIVDFKTSQQVWPEMEMQISAYKQTISNGENPVMFNGELLDVSNIKLGILQVGYKKNKNFFKWNDIEDAFPLFLNAKAIWARETEGQTVKYRDYPIVLSPALKVEDVIETKEVKDKPKPKIKKPNENK